MDSQKLTRQNDDEDDQRHIDADKLEDEKPNLDGDRMNFVMITLINLLQAVPISILLTMPLFLQKRGASYETQAQLSFSRWPVAFKLVWAPIVDGVYSVRFGRRKSWIVPMQLFIAVILILLSYSIDDLLGSKESPAQMAILLPVLIVLCVSINVQDVAHDAWVITMLHKRNIGYAPIAATLGQSIAKLLGNTSLLTLESADFCNTWLRTTPQPNGIITLSGAFH